MEHGEGNGCKYDEQLVTQPSFDLGAHNLGCIAGKAIAEDVQLRSWPIAGIILGTHMNPMLR